MKFHSLTLGGWYQRTTLHLTEIHDLFTRASSKLPLSTDKLSTFREGLNLETVVETGFLEYIHAKTKEGIEIKYYEDGLYTLSTSTSDIQNQTTLLTNYYEQKFKPAIDYIFSLGAPTPKILANIESTPPLALVIQSSNYSDLGEELFPITGPIYNQTNSEGIKVYKTPKYIVLASKKISLQVESLVESQIFFREFKDQLEKYLNSHRLIWEKISDIKEKKSIKGNQIEAIRNELDSYDKTISLINSRLNQMSTYVRTRASVTKDQNVTEYLNQLFQYKFETLTDTHSYVKDLWRMTGDYLNQGLKTISDLQAESTKDSIRSLQLITAIGVTSGLLGYLTKDSFPKFTLIGIIYFAALLIVTWIINQIITQIYKNLKYKIKFTEHKKLK